MFNIIFPQQQEASRFAYLKLNNKQNSWKLLTHSSGYDLCFSFPIIFENATIKRKSKNNEIKIKKFRISQFEAKPRM